VIDHVPNRGEISDGSQRPEPERAGGGDAVEAALVAALTAATAAGRFDVVGQLARDLEARRMAQAGNVVALRGRARRGRS
jgi:hypothetical protein